MRRTDVPPEPLRFASWVPNVSGGLGVSTIEQRTDWRHGADLVRCGFLHNLEDVEHSGREVLPLIREMEAAELARAGVAR